MKLSKKGKLEIIACNCFLTISDDNQWENWFLVFVRPRSVFPIISDFPSGTGCFLGGGVQVKRGEIRKCLYLLGSIYASRDHNRWWATIGGSLLKNPRVQECLRFLFWATVGSVIGSLGGDTGQWWNPSWEPWVKTRGTALWHHYINWKLCTVHPHTQRRCGDLVSRQRTPNTNSVSGKAPLFLTLHPKTSPHSAPLPRMVWPN